jgi:diaminobutyrate-2-oxoglutarate transaminase
MSLLLIRQDLDVWEPAEHTGTFRGNNLAFVAATAALEAWWIDEAFERSIGERGRELAGRLAELVRRHPGRFTARGIGLIHGLACRDPADAGRISRAAFERGLVIECAGARDEVVKAMPPLTIDGETLDRGCGILEQAIDAVVRGAA